MEDQDQHHYKFPSCTTVEVKLCVSNWIHFEFKTLWANLSLQTFLTNFFCMEQVIPRCNHYCVCLACEASRCKRLPFPEPAGRKVLPWCSWMKKAFANLLSFEFIVYQCVTVARRTVSLFWESIGEQLSYLLILLQNLWCCESFIFCDKNVFQTIVKTLIIFYLLP